MRKIVIASAVSLSLMGMSGAAQALGLGEIEMYSSLNQSLDAEISILSATSDDLQNMQVRLASPDAFARAGLEQLPVLASVKFDIDERPDGQPVVKITSDGPVLEPFLNFLIEVDSPGNVLLVREYTVLLDPPTFLADSVAPQSTSPQLVNSDTGVSYADDGVPIDLSDTIATEGLPAAKSAGAVQSFDATIGTVEAVASSERFFDQQGNEVTFTESSSFSSESTFVNTVSQDAGPDTDTIAADVELPDTSARTIVDADGQVISLEQELITTPQFEQPIFLESNDIFSASGTIDSDAGNVDNSFTDNSNANISSAEISNETVAAVEPETVTNFGGDLLSLDNLGAQGDPVFDNDFNSNDTDSALVIESDELQQLVESDTDVASTDIASPASAFVVSQTSEGVISQSKEVVFEETIIQAGPAFSSITSTDTDAAGDDPLDLSGVLESLTEPEPVTQQQTASNTSSSVGDEGVVVDISGEFLQPSSAETVSPVQTDGDISFEASGETYRVQKSDTLWRISNNFKAPGITPHQMMVALLRGNESAFVNGNMNQMSSGALLQIPTPAAQRSVSASNALAIVRSWTRDNKAPDSASNTAQPASSFTESTTASVGSTDLTRDLAEVNKRVEQARSELASETLQRDELKGRVNSLTDSMSKMESLITQRESELNELQEEVESGEEMMSAEGKGSDAFSGTIKEQQDAIERKADADKNLATAEAEAQSVRLSTEEDALRAQLAALQIEKRDLEAASQLEKADLVRQAELEKIRLLARAETEQNRIKAELDAEKARITSEASAEIARIRQNSDSENQRLLAEAEAERERLVNETAQMRAELQKMEAEKSQLLAQAQLENAELQREADEQARILAASEAEQARLQTQADEQARLTAAAEAERQAAEAERQAAEAERQAAADESSRVKDRLAKLQQESEAKQAEMALAAAEVSKEMNDSDAEGTVMNEAKDAGKAMAAGGAAAVGGLLGFAPLQEIIGERKNVLGVGAVLSFLGLIAAWAIRRRRPAVSDTAHRPRAQQQPSNRQPQRTNFDNRSTLYEDDVVAQPRRRPSAAAAATAGVAGVAAAGAASARQMQDDVSVQPTPEIRNEPSAPTEPASPTEEESALDDTITEAEVYLRYGLHGQAEDLLKTAIDRSPDNEEYHFKLLENYHDQKNASAFDEAAASFRDRFSKSAHLPRIDEMASEIVPDTSLFGPSVATTAVGASVASSIVAAKKVKADSSSALDDVQNAGDADPFAADSVDTDMNAGISSDGINNDLDQTLDPGTEFNMDELEATGNLGALLDESVEFEDQGNMSLDDVDLASLDDDGTLNLEEVVGSQMSGVDLGTLDLTNPDNDSTLDALTLDDADLNDLGEVGSDITSGLDSDISVEGVAPAGVGGSDEMETMLDLAKAYIDMGDSDSAASALKDIAARGNPMQQNEANELLKKLT